MTRHYSRFKIETIQKNDTQLQYYLYGKQGSFGSWYLISIHDALHHAEEAMSKAMIYPKVTYTRYYDANGNEELSW